MVLEPFKRLPTMFITLPLLAMASIGRVKTLCFESQMELPNLVSAEYYERSFDAGNRAPHTCSALNLLSRSSDSKPRKKFSSHGTNDICQEWRGRVYGLAVSRL